VIEQAHRFPPVCVARGDIGRNSGLTTSAFGVGYKNSLQAHATKSMSEKLIFQEFSD
jgi:hypothetical protein